MRADRHICGCDSSPSCNKANVKCNIDTIPNLRIYIKQIRTSIKLTFGASLDVLDKMFNSVIVVDCVENQFTKQKFDLYVFLFAFPV